MNNNNVPTHIYYRKKEDHIKCEEYIDMVSLEDFMILKGDCAGVKRKVGEAIRKLEEYWKTEQGFTAALNMLREITENSNENNNQDRELGDTVRGSGDSSAQPGIS